MRNKMFYILSPIYFVLLHLLYPLLVPKSVSPTVFVISYLLFILITAGSIRLWFDRHDAKKERSR